MAEQRQVLCIFCDKKLPSAEELRVHLQTHRNEKPQVKIRYGPRKPASVQSPPVVRQSSRKGGLKKLAKGGVGAASRFHCDECGEEFPALNYALTHKFRKHPSSTKRYNCSFCGKNFPLPVSLDLHLKSTHEGENSNRELPCPMCKDVFHNQVAMNYHIDMIHRRSVRIVDPVMTFPPSRKIKVNAAGEISHAIYCHLCGCEYMVKFNLQKHLLASHSEQERGNQPECLVKCDQCSAFFYSQKAYNAHLVHHTPEDLFVQTEGISCSTRIDADFHPHRVVAKPVKGDCPKSMYESLFGARKTPTANGRTEATETSVVVEEFLEANHTADSSSSASTNESIDLIKNRSIKVVKRLSSRVINKESKKTRARRT